MEIVPGCKPAGSIKRLEDHTLPDPPNIKKENKNEENCDVYNIGCL